MAEVKISDLANVTSLTGANTFPVVQSGTTKEADINDILNLVPICFSVAFSDETTAITAGVAKTTFHMPYGMVLTDVKVGLTAAGTGAVKSNSTVICLGVLAADTVTVNGLTYTAVSGARSNDTEFSIDTGDTECGTDLAAAITADTRTGTDVSTIDQDAASVTGTVTITAKTFGVAGDSILLSSSNGTRLAVSAANLAGGLDPFTVDLHEAGTTVLSTKVTVDSSEKTSATAIIPVVISDSALAVDALMTVDVDYADQGAAAKGGKIYLIGTRTAV